MGNCLALFKPSERSSAGAAAEEHGKVLQVVKMDGKILEFASPMGVKDLLVNFPRMGVSMSEKAFQYLPPTYELKIGKTYYLLPSPSSAAAGSVGPKQTVEAEHKRGVKRIKVVITKQQLQELLSKQISVEDVLFSMKRNAASSVDSPSAFWKPKLESIPEGVSDDKVVGINNAAE